MITLSEPTWLVEQHSFSTDPHIETCFTLANGFMGVRGSFEEMYAGEGHGTYVAGVFDQSEAQVTGLVNLPFFFGLRIYVDGVRIDADSCEVLDFYRALDLKQGILYKEYRLRDVRGNITRLEGIRFVSQHDRQAAGIRYKIVAENYCGSLTVESITDGTTLNGSSRPQDKVKHYNVRTAGPMRAEGMYLEAETRDQGLRVGIATALRVTREGENVAAERRRRTFGEQALESVEANLAKGQTVIVEKYIIVVNSKIVEKEALPAEAERLLVQFTSAGMITKLKDSIEAYAALWHSMNIEIDGDPEAERAIRFNLFHLANCANPDDERVSIGAKGLHGEGYKGHVFWDTEIFMLPFFTYTYPKAARSMLMYRYHLLGAARANAKEGGYGGARYPWESADSGKEETPRWGWDYGGNRIRVWTGDLEYHITADIAFAVWQYYRATGDETFFLDYGVEMILETARFWSTRAEYNAADDRYEIRNVIGPDEFHEHVDNNLYTNYLARWNLHKGLEVLDALRSDHPGVHDRLVSNLGITAEELSVWRETGNKMYVPAGDGSSPMEQHEGYFELEDRVITEFDANHMPMWPQGLDRTKLNDYTLLKQADIIQLLHMFGEEFDSETKKINFDYYEKRTIHKSSLSPSIYCIMGLTVGNSRMAYDYLMRTALVDLANNQGNAVEGLHAASTGGTWQAVVNGFGGMAIEPGGGLGFSPSWLPEHWNRLSYRIQWKGCLLQVTVNRNRITIEQIDGTGQLQVYVYGELRELKSGEPLSMPAILS